MKYIYSTPQLVEYGRLETLTLGQHGNLPDYNVNGGLVANDNCSTSAGPGGSGNSSPFTCDANATHPAIGS